VKRQLVGANILLAVLGLGTAQAAPPVYDWTGFYVGINAGYGLGSQNWNQTFNNQGNPNDTTSSALPLKGFLGGLQGGYNFQTGLGSLASKATGPGPAPMVAPATRSSPTTRRAHGRTGMRPRPAGSATPSIAV
jgi:opacity protein-like surface antigen